MPRHLQLIFPAILLAICVLFSGCDTVYTEMYSPKRNRFVPSKPKPQPEAAPIILDEPAPSSTVPLLPPAPSAAPVVPPAPAPDGAAPVIPGLQ